MDRSPDPPDDRVIADLYEQFRGVPRISEAWPACLASPRFVRLLLDLAPQANQVQESHRSQPDSRAAAGCLLVRRSGRYDRKPDRILSVDVEVLVRAHVSGGAFDNAPNRFQRPRLPQTNGARTVFVWDRAMQSRPLRKLREYRLSGLPNSHADAAARRDSGALAHNSVPTPGKRPAAVLSCAPAKGACVTRNSFRPIRRPAGRLHLEKCGIT